MMVIGGVEMDIVVSKCTRKREEGKEPASKH